MIAPRPAVRGFRRGVRTSAADEGKATDAGSLAPETTRLAYLHGPGRLGYLTCGPPSRDADRSKSLSRQQVVSEQLIERLRPLLRKKYPRASQLDRRLRSGDRFRQPVRPFDRKIDVVRSPDDKSRGPQCAQLRLNVHRVLVVERRDEPL